MLDSIKIQNFQNHEKKHIDLDWIVSIIGLSDVGKSAILRAFRWNMLNKPIGQVFRKHGSSSTKVTIRVDNEVVSRKRSNSDNTYELNGDEYRSFSDGVPDTIANLLNVSDLNFQGQHEGAFWLSLSPAELSRRLNSIVDLSLMDRTMENLNREVHRYRDAYNNADKAHKETQGKLAKYDWVDEADKDYSAYEYIKEQLDAQKTTYRKLNKLVESINKHNKIHADKLNQLFELKAIQLTAETIVEKQNKVNRLEELLESIKRTKVKINQVRPDISHITKTYENLLEVKKKTDVLKELLGGIETNRNYYELCMRNKAAYQKIINDEYGKICPVCGK